MHKKLPIVLTLFPFIFAAKCRKDQKPDAGLSEIIPPQQQVIEPLSPESRIQVLGMTPDTVEVGVSFTAQISGIGFFEDSRIYLGEEELYDISYLDSHHFEIGVGPQNLGAYDLRVENSDGGSHTLRAALFVEEGLTGSVDGVVVGPEFPEECRDLMLQFGFNEDRLNDNNKQFLKEVQNCFSLAGMNYTIEGHTDERGTTDYNLALGERRASVVKQYLLLAGVPVAQLQTISFGEEQPIDDGSTEEAWKKNRRAVIQIKE